MYTKDQILDLLSRKKPELQAILIFWSISMVASVSDLSN